MILLAQSLICLSYIYETYKYTFLETVAGAKHRLQALQSGGTCSLSWWHI